MCGISAILSASTANNACVDSAVSVEDLKVRLRQQLANRGPDAQNEATLHEDYSANASPSSLWLFGSVLHIQGSIPARQPYEDLEGNQLLWNGEVFGWDDRIAHKFDLKYGESDTAAISQYLRAVIGACTSASAVAQIITTALASIHGPYAFIYFHKPSSSLHFGRDPFGRRSLLILSTSGTVDSDGGGIAQSVQNACDDGVLALTSVAPPAACDGSNHTGRSTSGTSAEVTEERWLEVDISGLYTVENVLGAVANARCYGTPWPSDRVRLARGSYLRTTLVATDADSSANTDAPEQLFLQTVQNAVDRRVRSIVGQSDVPRPVSPPSTGQGTAENAVRQADVTGCDAVSGDVTDSSASSSPTAESSVASKVGVLFSGGIDSVLLSALLHRSLDPVLAIDLLNVTFLKDGTATHDGDTDATHTAPRAAQGEPMIIKEDPQPSPDRVAAIAAHQELQTLFPERGWRLVHIDVGERERFAHERRVRDLIQPSDTHMDLNIGTAFWFASRGEGYLRSYTAAEISALLGAAMGSSGGDGDDDAGGRAVPPSRSYAQRPILRHGGAGAAAGVGRQWSAGQQGGGLSGEGTVANASESGNNDAPAPILELLSPGKYKCVVERCQRVYKEGCLAYCCKKCCDAAHRQRALASQGGSSLADLRATPELLCNPCPAHRTKQRHLAKIASNAAAQARAHRRVESPDPVACSSDTEACHADAAGEALTSLKEALPVKRSVPAGEGEDGVSTRDHALIASGTTPASTPRSAEASAPTAMERSVTVTAYRSHCKALLVGIGADEQMAGYGRHRTVFLKALTACDGAGPCIADGGDSRVGYALAALQEELNKDLTRLWQRNLGRDDRCVSDHGREAWFPFLDEQVVSLLHNLPLHQITDLSQPQGVGDKRILRQAARKLGLGKCTELVKRAIQFGTRVAQHTNQHYHGSNRKGKGDAKL